MGVIWHKVWFDLWHNKLRTTLVIISITVGVFAVGATFGMVEQMLPTMDAAHQSSLPSHVTMYLTRPISQEEILALRKLPGVEEADGFNVVEVRWKKRPEDPWKIGNILHRDYEHQLYDILQLKEGNWPEGMNLNIERMHSPFYHLGPGDHIIVETGKQERSFMISGKIRHPFVPPPSMYDVAWFFGSEDVMEFFNIPKNEFVQVKFRVTDYTPENARLVATNVKEWLAKQGYSVSSTLYQDPEKHWGRAFLDGMSLVLEVIAVLSLLLSIVLVMNTLTAVITQQTNQIGILKAIGGTTLSITRIYLAAVLVYGLLSLFIAWPLGAVASFRISQSFLSLYNIEYESYAISNRILIIQAFAAIAVPLLAALLPVLGGAAITVRQAISSYGVGGDFGTSWIDRLIERIGRRFLVSYQAIALANTFRRKGRLVLTQLVLITSGVMFLIVMTLSESITATMDAEFGRRSHDIIVTFDDIQRIDKMCSFSTTVAGVQKADMWLVAPATVLHQGQKALDAGLGSQLQGVPIPDAMYKPLIVAGRWLEPGDDRVVVMNQQTADDEGIQIGDTISLDLGDWGQSDWDVVGFYKIFLVFGGGFSVDAIYAPRQAVFEATKKFGKGTSLLIQTVNHSDNDIESVNSHLKDLFKSNHIAIRQTETIPQMRKTSNASFEYVIAMLMVLAVVVAIVGGIGLMGSLWISVIERTKEIGIMRAIGAGSLRIISMFILEGIIQGLMSWVISIPISMAVAPFMSYALGMTMFKSQLDYRYNFQATFIWLAVILIISSLASAIPARSASQINVRQSLSYE